MAGASERTVRLAHACGVGPVRTFSENDKQLRGTPGAIAVLHTHARRLDYHPHVHLVMPAAAVDTVRKRWNTKRAPGAEGGYLFSHKALAKVFRAKILAGIAQAGLAMPVRHPGSWVVDCKSVRSGDKALVDLGRYLYRGVIAEKNIVAVRDGQVSFRYQNAKTKKMELRTVPGAQFLWLVLQYVLPKGFRRARHFGILHSNCKRLITLLHVLLKCLPPPRYCRAQEAHSHRLPVLRGSDVDRANAVVATAIAACATSGYGNHVSTTTTR